MKNVTGRVTSEEPITLSRAAKILSGFVSSKNGASQDVSAYLRRAAAAFIELKSIHREIKSSKKPRSEAGRQRNPTDEFEKLGGAKGIDIGFRKSETDCEDESIYAKEQDGIKENKEKTNKKSKNKRKEDVVEEKFEEDSRNKEKKRKNDAELASEERKSKKRRKSKEIDG